MAKRDWYRRKLNKHWQEFFDRLANSKRFSKEEIRELDRERHDPITRHEFAIGSLIANHLNYFINTDIFISLVEITWILIWLFARVLNIVLAIFFNNHIFVSFYLFFL